MRTLRTRITTVLTVLAATLLVHQGVSAQAPDLTPLLFALPAQTATVGQPTSVVLPPAIGGNPPLTHSAEGLPDGLSFDDATRTISGTPSRQQTSTATYRVTDADGDVATTTFTYTVLAANTNPTATANASPNPTPSGGAVTLTGQGTDPDGDTLHYRWTASPAVGTFADPDASDTTWTAPTEGQPRTVALTLTVRDGSGGRAAITIHLLVRDDTTPSLPTPSEQTGTVGAAVSLTLPRAARGEPPITYSVTGLPDGLNFTPDTRDVSGTPTTEQASAVRYTATDQDGDSASADFTWTIRPATPAGDNGPFTVSEGETLVGNLAAPAAAGTNPAWSITEGDAGGTDAAHFRLSAGGVLEFISAQDYEDPDDADGDGTFEVIVSAGQHAERITVILANINEPPDAVAGDDQTEIQEGDTVTLDASGSSDPDQGDAPTYRWTQKRGDAVTLAGADTTIATFTAADSLLRDSFLTFAVTVTDGGGLARTDTVFIRVQAANGPTGSDAHLSTLTYAFELMMAQPSEEDTTRTIEEHNPWLREAWDYANHQGDYAEGDHDFEILVNDSEVPWVRSLCEGIGHFYVCEPDALTIPVSFMADRYVEGSIRTLRSSFAHELGHVFAETASIPNEAGGEPRPDLKALGLIYFDQNYSCPRSPTNELMADALRILVYPSTRGTGYWARCTDGVSDDLAVVESIMQGQYSDWFVTAYGQPDGGFALRQLWNYITGHPDQFYKNDWLWMMRDAFTHGYCNPLAAGQAVYRGWPLANPWSRGDSDAASCHVPEAATRWWNTLDDTQRAAAILGEAAKPDLEDAAAKPFDDLDPGTRLLVNDAAMALYGPGEHPSVGAWWQGLTCRLRRVATGESNVDDQDSPFCAGYPGSGESPVLSDAHKGRVDIVGQALLGRSNPGTYPPAVPGKPRPPELTLAEPTTVVVEWVYPDDHGAPINDQSIEVKKLDGSLRRSGVSGTRQVLRDLDPDTTYLISVQAYNAVGRGGFSNPARIHTSGDLTPSLPNDLRDRSHDTDSAVDVTLPPALGGDGTVTYTLAGLPAGLSFNTQTRQVTGTPTQGGTFTITYTATDSDLDADSETFQWTVSAGEPAPVDLMPDLPFVPAQTATNGETVGITLPAATGGDAPVTYATKGLPTGLLFDPQTRQVTGAPTESGTFAVTYRATDADGHEDSVSFSWTVVDAFTITTMGPFSVNEGETAVANLAAPAPADATVTWSIGQSESAGDDAEHFTLTTAGVLYFTTPQNYENPADQDADGTYALTVVATHGENSASALLSVTLLDVNEAPNASAGADQDGITEGATVPLDGTGSGDPDDGDVLTYSWTQTGGDAVTLSDAAVASPTFTAPSGLTADTTLVFQLTVTDQGRLAATDTVAIMVIRAVAVPAAPDAPTVTLVDASTVRVEWTAPDDGGSPITSYGVVWKEQGGFVSHGMHARRTSTVLRNLDLKADTTYEFRVLAVNDAGRGDWSEPGTLTTPS